MPRRITRQDARNKVIESHQMIKVSVMKTRRRNEEVRSCDDRIGQPKEMFRQLFTHLNDLQQQS